MFSALVLRGGGQDIHEVVVVLIPSEGGDGAVTCTVSAAGADGEAIRVSAPGRHVYDAIDRAASRIRRRTWAPKREVM